MTDLSRMTEADLVKRLRTLRAELGAAPADSTRAQNLRAAIAAAEQRQAEIERQKQRILAGAARGDTADHPIFQTPKPKHGGGLLAGAIDRETGGQRRDQALACIENLAGRDKLAAADADRLDTLVRGDIFGIEGLYIRATASPSYETAFGKLVMFGAGAPAKMTPDEVNAVQAVEHVRQLRSMTFSAGLGEGGSGQGGGYAVPATLDPTIVITNSGTSATNPVRDRSRVITISTKSWTGVASAGVTATRRAEFEQVGDGTPTLAPLELTPTRVDCWVETSIELGMDWASMSGDLSRLIADAKMVEETTSFTTGPGTAVYPQGAVTGGSAYITGSTVAAVNVDHVYAVPERLGARWQDNAVWMGNLSTLNDLGRLVPTASTADPQIFDAAGRLLHREYVENPQVPAIGPGSPKPLLYGDFQRGYTIVDRIGMTIEVVAHVMGADRRPIGARGFFAYWRNTAKVTVPDAIRVLHLTN